MQKIFVYKNYGSKNYLFIVLYTFIALLVGYFNGFFYFLIAFITMLGIPTLVNMISPYTLYYDTITVDNKSKKLIFKSVDDTCKIFPYNEIDKICYLPNDYDSSGRVLHFIEIYHKSGSVSEISFSWAEFSLDFLKKLPKNIVVTKLPPSTAKQIILLIAAIIAITSIIVTIPKLQNIL